MTFYFGSNLKMNHSPAQTRAFVERVCTQSRLTCNNTVRVQLWIAPSHLNICAAREVAKDSTLWIGAQNVHWAESGAFTGEVSAWQVAQTGVDFVMVGHIERRTFFGDTDALVGLKVKACARHHLRVMLCIGEGSTQEGDCGRETVLFQLKSAIVDFECSTDLIILYEQAWSVGAGGSAADPAYVAGTFSAIKAALIGRYGPAGADVPLLYGGSVTATNAAAYSAIPGCSGLGVGRAGWDADAFLRVLDHSLGALPNASRQRSLEG
jgi:triosephosphate isomerase